MARYQILCSCIQELMRARLVREELFFDIDSLKAIELGYTIMDPCHDLFFVCFVLFIS